MTAYPAWTPAARPGIVPLHPLSFGTILGRSFTALRHNPRVLLGFAIGAQAIAYVVLTAAIGAVGFATFSRLLTVPETSDDFATILVGSIVITAAAAFVLGLAASALTVIVQGVIVVDVATGVVAERLRLPALWRRVRPAFWRLFGYTLLTSAAILVAFLLVGGLIALLGFAVSGPGGIVLAVVLSLLTILAAVPIGYWLVAKLSLVPAILVLEGARIFPAIARSWRLVRRRFWVAFGVIIIVQWGIGIVAQVVSIPFSLVSQLLPAVITPTGADDPGAVVVILVLSLLTQAVTLLVQAIGVVVFATATTLLYVDNRMRKEGLDQDLQSYVEQRQAGAGEADPYRWNIGRDAPSTYVPPVPVIPAAYPGSPAPFGVPPYPGAPQPYGAAPYPGAPGPSGAPQPYGMPPYPGAAAPQPSAAPGPSAAPDGSPAPSHPADAPPPPPYAAPGQTPPPAPSDPPAPPVGDGTDATRWAPPGGGS